MIVLGSLGKDGAFTPTKATSVIIKAKENSKRVAED
jgi:hypothetical protein